eukprot:scaffold440872_cov19-Prasinocladus_malaysianus.AAC.1
MPVAAERLFHMLEMEGRRCNHNVYAMVMKWASTGNSLSKSGNSESFSRPTVSLSTCSVHYVQATYPR